MRKLFIILLALPILGIDGCKEEIKDDDGPEVSGIIIRSSICYELSASQVAAIKIGETSIAAKSKSVFNGNSFIEESHKLTVLDKERQLCRSGQESIPCDHYLFVEEITNWSSGEMFAYERDHYLPVVDQAIVTSKENSRDATIDNSFCFFTEEDYQQAGLQMSFHNFSKTSFEKDPPEAVRQREDCGGVKNCKLHVTHYSFDQIVVNNGQKTKTKYTFEISNDVPFFSRALKRCMTYSGPHHFDDNENGQVDSGEVRVITINECRDVVDFQYGTE